MSIIVGGDYLIIISEVEKYNCKVLGESEKDYFVYIFHTEDGILFTNDELGHIPKAVYDQRNLLLITKKNIKNVFSIYVVNSIHFKKDFIQYKVGRKNMYQISYQYKKGSEIKEPITKSMFPYCSYAHILEMEVKTWIQIKVALGSNVLNQRYNYFQFTNCLSDHIQHEISLYKPDKGSERGSFSMHSIVLN